VNTAQRLRGDFAEEERKMTSEIVMVYFEDLDAMGVVHNGRYAVLLERALAAYWDRAGWSYDPGPSALRRGVLRGRSPRPFGLWMRMRFTAALPGRWPG
jgi:hypothetical protein